MASSGKKPIMTYRSYHINPPNQFFKRKDLLVIGNKKSKDSTVSNSSEELSNCLF